MHGAFLYPKISLDNLFRIAKEGGKQTPKQAAKSFLKHTGTEAAEEAISEAAGNAADQIIMGNRSEYQRYIDELKAQGLSQSEAEGKALARFYAANPFMAGVGGAISGGILGAGAQAVGNAAYRGDVRQATREVSPEAQQKLINAGLRSDPTSSAYKLAVQAVNKTAAGEKMSTNNLAKLYIAVERDNGIVPDMDDNARAEVLRRKTIIMPAYNSANELAAPEGANKPAPETGTENTRLTVSDEQAYSQTGNRPQIKRSNTIFE